MDDGPVVGAPVLGWPRALLRAAIILAASFIAFASITNWLVGYLSLHVSPGVRDLLVLVWWIVAFAALSWLFVRLQLRRGR